MYAYNLSIHSLKNKKCVTIIIIINISTLKYIVLISTHPRGGQSGVQRSNNRRDYDVGGCALATVARDRRLESQLSLFTV